MTDPTPTAADDFYDAPPLGFDPSPGTILRRRPVILPGLTGVSTAWQVVYATRTGFSAPIPASGTVLIPDPANNPDGYRILLYCPTFHGLGGPCAPSQKLAAGTEGETPQIEAALARGWTVIIPDGLGLGMTGVGPHLWLSGAAAAHAGLDLARTVGELLGPGVASIPSVVWGYADGGRAAVWTAELAGRYAPDIDLRGVIAGAVASDLGALARDLDGTPCAGLVLAGLVGLGRAYSHLPLDHLLTTFGRLVSGRAGDMDAAGLLAQHRAPVSSWCERPDPWEDPMWRYVLTTERRSGHLPQVPAHLYHGFDDPVIPITQGRRLADEYRAEGVQVSWRDYPSDHTATASTATGDALDRAADFLTRSPHTPPATSPDAA
ncbi:lipase family protein [Nocardia rhamnosiphila]|uniref:lipase family protein n=1 Tax=Nocardia rhamnosiphila TaxID=426716 RepID=UPI0033C55102